MKVTIAALAQSQPETASLGSGSASGSKHDGGFAQLLRGSLGKLQGNSSSPAATPATPFGDFASQDVTAREKRRGGLRYAPRFLGGYRGEH